jgi:uncharacterized protein YaaN involved in tellurite resistance
MIPQSIEEAEKVIQQSLARIDEKIRLADSAAEVIEQFLEKARPEIAKFSEAFPRAMEALIRQLMLRAEFSSFATEDLDPLLMLLANLKSALASAENGIKTFRTSFDTMPPVTTRIIRAKREALSALQGYTAKMQSATPLISDATSSIRHLQDTLRNMSGTGDLVSQN